MIPITNNKAIRISINFVLDDFSNMLSQFKWLEKKLIKKAGVDLTPANCFFNKKSLFHFSTVALTLRFKTISYNSTFRAFYISIVVPAIAFKASAPSQ